MILNFSKLKQSLNPAIADVAASKVANARKEIERSEMRYQQSIEPLRREAEHYRISNRGSTPIADRRISAFFKPLLQENFKPFVVVPLESLKQSLNENSAEVQVVTPGQSKQVFHANTSSTKQFLFLFQKMNFVLHFFSHLNVKFYLFAQKIQ